MLLHLQVTSCVYVTVVNCLMDISFILRLPSVKLFPLSYQIIPGVFPPSLYNFVLVSLWLQPTLWGRAMNILWFYFLFMCNNDQLICIVCLFFVCYTVWARYLMWLNTFRENMFSNYYKYITEWVHTLISLNIIVF